MHVLVTGALGTVGRRVVRELIRTGHNVTGIDVAAPRRRLHRPLRVRTRLSSGARDSLRLLTGEITDSELVTRAVAGVDAVIHLAAIIPPKADREPELARRVNVEGTRTLVEAMERHAPNARLIFASSIAVYGDRVTRPLIAETDPPAPNPEDHYANQKVAAEKIVRASGVPWLILRLTYVVAADALVLDPLLFDMPPATAIEPCDVSDVAHAFCRAAVNPAGTVHTSDTLLIAGGAGWRIMYRDYLDMMLRAFGLGGNFLPTAAFGGGPFHCAFMDTARSERLLQYQRHTFRSFISRVRRERRVTRALVTMVRPLARAYLLSRSPHFRTYLGRRAHGEAARLLLRFRACFGLRLTRGGPA